MLIETSLLPASSRVWIYQANRTLTEAEEQDINRVLAAFCQQWMAHGQPLNAGFEVRHHRFVILLVDESGHAASGCSIDGSVHVMKNLQNQLGIDFFDRTQVAFWANGQIVTIPFTRLKQAFGSGEVNGQTLAFNLQAATKDDLDNHWLIPAEKTWLAKYLPKSSLVS